MKRYLLSFLAAYLAAVGVTLGLLLIGLMNWWFTDVPLWFEMLCVVLVSLTVLGAGEIFGRRPKAKQVAKPIRGFLILLPVMVLLAFVTALEDSILYAVSFPGMMLGTMLHSSLEISHQWEPLFYFLGNLLLPCPFHLGWHWGTES